MKTWLLFVLLLAGFIAACNLSLTVPENIGAEQLAPVDDDAVKVQRQACVDRLNTEGTNARHAAHSADAVAIVGASVSASTGVTSAILAALSADTGDRGQKIAAAITAGFSAAGAILAVIAKILESPVVPLGRRAKAETGFVVGTKMLTFGTDPVTHKFVNPTDRNVALAAFIQCQAAIDTNQTAETPPPTGAINLIDGGAPHDGGVHH